MILRTERLSVIASVYCCTKKAAAEAVLSKIKEGDTIEGTVKNVTDFGAFIDLGGVDGLLHISEMSWEEQRILRRFTRLVIQLSALSKRLTEIRLHFQLSIQTLIHGITQSREVCCR